MKPSPHIQGHTTLFMQMVFSACTRISKLCSTLLISIDCKWCFSNQSKVLDLFVLIKSQCRCDAEDILLEMDRILRPEGAVIFRDHMDVLVKVSKIVRGMRWNTKMVDHEDGPLVPEKVLFAVKRYWVAGEDNSTSSE